MINEFGTITRDSDIGLTELGDDVSGDSSAWDIYICCTHERVVV